MMGSLSYYDTITYLRYNINVIRMYARCVALNIIIIPVIKMYLQMHFKMQAELEAHVAQNMFPYYKLYSHRIIYIATSNYKKKTLNLISEKSVKFC